MFQPTALPACADLAAGAEAGASAAIAETFAAVARKAATSAAVMRESFTETDLCKDLLEHALPTSEKPLEDMPYHPRKPLAGVLFV